MLLEVVTAMVDLMFYRSLEYIERPAERRATVDRWVRLARAMLIGATSPPDGQSSRATTSGR